MSVEAIHWALNQAPIPRDRRDASSLAIVLVGLANHAGPDGTNAFPSIATLVSYTRLSRRSVQHALQELADLGLIRPSDPEIVAAYVKRADRRPKGWDLVLDTPPPVIHNVVHSRGDGVQAVHPDGPDGVQARPHGVQTRPSRGAEAAPEPSLNRPETTARARARAPRPGPVGVPPLCGHCDGRPHEPVNTRVVWLDDTHQRSVPCPRCNPRSPHYPTSSTPA